MSRPTRLARKTGRGFTLIELLVVVLIIGILAAIAVPKYFKIVEQGRFSEAINCISVIKQSQERSWLKNQMFAGAISSLDVPCAAPRYFNAAVIISADSQTYSARLTRIGGPPPYGDYQLLFYGGHSGEGLSCNQPDCQSELVPLFSPAP